MKADIQSLLQEGNPIQFHPSGVSMFPLFVSSKDYAIVSPLSQEYTPKRLDVLVYRRPEGPLIIHRVYRNNKKGLYMVGDRQTIIEGPLPKECALGIMTGYIRKGKQHTTKYIPYRMYSFLWMAVRPLRHFCFKIGHIIKIAYHKITRKEITKWY